MSTMVDSKYTDTNTEPKEEHPINPNNLWSLKTVDGDFKEFHDDKNSETRGPLAWKMQLPTIKLLCVFCFEL
jgi:hypothetical protein